MIGRGRRSSWFSFKLRCRCRASQSDETIGHLGDVPRAFICCRVFVYQNRYAALAARILSDPLTPTLICELAVGCELDLNINPDRLNDFSAFIDAGFIGWNRWQKMVVHWQHCHPTDDASEDRNIGAVVLAPGCGPRDILRLQGASVLATGP